MNEREIEQEIQAKGLNAPRLTPESIEAAIIAERYAVANDFEIGEVDQKRANTFFLEGRSLACLTICVLVLRNGFTVVGKSACASPENFNVELGRKIARENAKAHIWELEGYLLKQRLAEGGDRAA